MNPRTKHMVVWAAGIGGVALLLVMAGLTGLAWYRLRQDLSQPPPRTATALAPSIPTSTVALPVKLPFKELTARIEAAAPKTFSGSGNGPPVCSGDPKVCSPTHYQYRANRGPVQVSQGPQEDKADSLRVTVPFTVMGNAALAGAPGKAAQPPKGFVVSTQAIADVSFAMGPDGCPKMQIAADVAHNLTVQVPVVPGAPVDLAQTIKEGAQKSLQALNKGFSDAMRCADVKKVLADLWARRSFPVQLLGGSRLYANIDPVSFGYSGLKLTPEAASFMLSLGVQVSVTDAALPAQTRPLPPWTPVALAPGAVHLSIPLKLSYQGIDAQLLPLLASHPLEIPTPRGTGKIAVDRLNIYPSGDHLAVGAHISTTMPDQFFDTGGWVYWTAQPQLLGEKAVQLANVGISKVNSDPLMEHIIQAVDGEMQKGLASAGQFDLTQSLEKSVEQVKTGLTQSKLSFDLSNPTVSVGHVVLGKDAVYVEAVFSAGAAAPAVPPAGA